MQVEIVKADPTHSFGAVLAVKVENCGESPTTLMPQINKKMKNFSNGLHNELNKKK